MSGQKDVLISKLALGIDVEVVALLQAHGCVLEQGDGCLWLTYPPGTIQVEIYPRVHAPRYMVTLPDGYQLEEHGDISSGLRLLYYQPSEGPRAPLRLETVFRYRQGQWVRVLVGPQQGVVAQIQSRQQYAGLERPPRYSLAGAWYEEQDLALAEEVAEGREEKESEG